MHGSSVTWVKAPQGPRSGAIADRPGESAPACDEKTADSGSHSDNDGQEYVQHVDLPEQELAGAWQFGGKRRIVIRVHLACRGRQDRRHATKPFARGLGRCPGRLDATGNAVMKPQQAGLGKVRPRATGEIAHGVHRAIHEKLAEGRPADHLAQAQGAQQVADIVAQVAPLRRPGDFQDQPEPVDPLGEKPASGPGPDVGTAQNDVQIASEEDVGPLDIAGPIAKEIHILPVVACLQRLKVMATQAFAREGLALRADPPRRSRDEQPHGSGRPGEIGEREINADGARRSADRQAVVDQIGDIARPAAANQLGSENTALAVLHPGPKRR